MTRPVASAAFIVSKIVASLGCGDFEQAKVRGSNISSMMAIKDVSIAIEQFRSSHGSYPTATTLAELQKATSPLLDHAQTTDRWGELLLVDVSGGGYVVTSKGDDRTGGPEFGGAVSNPGHSITLKDGVFVQYDASVERTARKFEEEIAGVRNQKQGGV